MGAMGPTLGRWCLVLLPALAWLPATAAGAERGVAAMITEIHVGQGQVEVGSGGEGYLRFSSSRWPAASRCSCAPGTP